ncbi:unnamed protein product, partial [Prorocentrum cordatum]
DKLRWQSLSNVVGATGLQACMQETAPVYTWTPTGEQQGQPIWLDHCFASAGTVATARATWDCARGDHSWLIVKLSSDVQSFQHRPQRKVWQCTDMEEYERELATIDVDSLESVEDIARAVAATMDKFTSRQTSRQRRRTREPMQINELRRRVRCTLDLGQKVHLNKLLTDMRKQWLAKKWEVEGVDRARRLKRLPSTRTGLHAITSMQIGRETTQDHTAWATACQVEMVKRWTEANETRAGSWMNKDTPGQTGISLARKVVNLLLVDDIGWDAVELEGYSKSKIPGVALPAKIRTVIPHNTILSTCHACVQERVVSITAAWSEAQGLDFLILGGSKHHQLAEVTFTCNQLVEKSIDRRNAGAMGSMDVANFHDCLCWDSACDIMARRGVPAADAMVLMRLHSRPQVRIRVGNALTDAVVRIRGAFTGARTAAAIAQWVIEDAFVDSAGSLAGRGWELAEGRFLSAMAWADNLVSFGDSVREAAGVLTIIEEALIRQGHTIKDDSQELLQVSQQPLGEWQLEHGGSRWQVKDELVIIGRTVSGNASSHADRTKALLKIQRSWFKHRRLLQNSALPFGSRAEMRGRHAESILNFYAGTWALAKQMVQTLDSTQLRYVAQMSKIPRLPFEEFRLWR